MKLDLGYHLFILYTIFNVVSGQDTSSVTNQETTVALTTTPAAATSTTTVSVTTTSTSSSAIASTTDLGDCLSADAFSTHDYFPNKLNFNNLGKYKLLLRKGRDSFIHHV